MTIAVDGARLDDPEAMRAADPGDMLRQVASAAAQIREAQFRTAEAGIDALAAGSRPRALVVTGMGASAIAGDVLAAVCGVGCPVPIVTVRGYQLPGWVGATDLVIAVSYSGSTEETLAVAVEAARRGSTLLCVGAAGSPLADIAAQAGGVPFIPVGPAGRPRAALWGLTVPLVLAARLIGLLEISDDDLEDTAQRLEDISHRCRPSSESFINPGKQLASELAGAVPMVWGTSALADVAAYRFACQCGENAKYPCVYGALPETNHNQIVAFDGPFGGSRAVAGEVGGDTDYFFRDRTDDEERGLHVVVLRDVAEHPRVARRREVSAELARARGIPVTEIAAEGTHPLERIATLIALADYTSVYLAIALGIDPTSEAAGRELKARIADQ